MKRWFLQVVFLVLSARPSLSIVIPWAVAWLDICHVLASSILGLDFVNKGRIDLGAVGIQVAFLAAVDDDARYGRSNFDVRVSDAVLGERQIDFAGLSLPIARLMNSYSS
jgi:hypothetical protein